MSCPKGGRDSSLDIATLGNIPVINVFNEATNL